MKSLQSITPLLLAITGLALNSCASVKKVSSSSVAAVRNTTSATAAKLSQIDMPDVSLASILPGPKVPVVEVREEELKELPTGHERALAYEKQRHSGFWIFGGPVDFEEPDLPEPGAELDGSLLPPRVE